MTTDSGLHVERGGTGPRTLLLLHGMGGSAGVWHGFVPLLSDEWSWIAPDLPGHGRSPHAASYTLDTLAAAVAPSVGDADEVTVLGHSLGGAVALTLAANHPELPMDTIVATSMKVQWSAEELAGAAAVAAKPARVFADRAEAVDRALKVAGLAGFVDPDAPAAATLVAEVDGGWRASFDPTAVGIGVPDVAGPVRALLERGTPMVLACGENDTFSPAEHLAAIFPGTLTLPKVGHNIPAERPEILLELLESP